MTLVKTPIPYEIPLSCLLSIYKLPALNSLDQIDNYTEKHEFGFNIYKLNGNKGEFSVNFPGKIVNHFNPLFFHQGKSRYRNSVNIGAKRWPSDKIYWLPSDNNIVQQFYCHKEECGYHTNLTANLKIHEHTCKVETTVNAKAKGPYSSIIFKICLKTLSKQVSYGISKHLIRDLISDDILPEELQDFTIDHFVTYDIEVIQDKSEQNLLSPISIGLASTFTAESYFERASSSPHDGALMVNEFMNHLVDMYTSYKAM